MSSRQLLRITHAEKMPDGRVRVEFSDQSYSILTLADIMSAGLYHGDFLPSQSSDGAKELVHSMNGHTAH